MKRKALVGLVFAVAAIAISLAAADPTPPWLAAYREPANRIIGEALGDKFAWTRLAELTDRFGHRLSGSPQLEAAIRWAVDEMKKDGLENVRAEPVMVPRWVRGSEQALIVKPVQDDIAMLGLGGSVGTGPNGIEAESLVVRSFDELDRRSASAKGRIVVYNVPFVSYSETVQYRYNGAARAAGYGAVATLVRSIGPTGSRTPHTGATRYEPESPSIPAAAIAAEDAERLQRMQDRGTPAVIRLRMDAETLPDTLSANVVGELRGRERPEEIVVVGGHIDSWDVGAGASDDGAGVVVTWDALRVIKKLGLRPLRTIRVVLWTNEENGLRGGTAYATQHKDELKNHLLMIECDLGVFHPMGFGFTGSERTRSSVRDIVSLVDGIGLNRLVVPGEGADIGPSVQAANIPIMSLDADTTFFFSIHHTAADTVDKIDPMDMSRSVAGVGVLAYVTADMPTRLGQ